MATFAEFVTKVRTAIDDNNTRTETYVKESAVRWLRELSQYRTRFMESTFSFATVAGTNEYDTATTGFPDDLSEIHSLYTLNSGGPYFPHHIIEGPASIEELRSVLGTQATGPEPMVYAYHHEKLILAPIPSTVFTIYGDYLKDGTLDTNGNAITTASTTATNGWLTQGENCLFHHVLADYYATIAKDEVAATMERAMAAEALKNVLDKRGVIEGTGLQSAWCF